jgi:hypothetical protein
MTGTPREQPFMEIRNPVYRQVGTHGRFCDAQAAVAMIVTQVSP